MIYTEPQTITSIRTVNVRDELVEEEYEMRIGGEDICPACRARSEYEYGEAMGKEGRRE